MKRYLRCCLTLALLVTAALPAEPSAGTSGGPSGEPIAVVELPPVDAKRAQSLDELRVRRGEVPHFAVVHEVQITPWSHGHWERIDGSRARWTLRLRSPGALSLSLAFGRYSMPRGGRLRLASAEGRRYLRPFTSEDNEDHGQLWTPPVLADEVVLVLVLPVDRLQALDLELTRVHHGYAGFGESGPRSGACHRDVACAEAAAWRDQARSVGLITIEGVRFCTGFLVNNTAFDGRPLFLTASHCGVSRQNAPSVVVFWRHATPTCRDGGAGLTDRQEERLLRRFQTGAVLRASYHRSDFALLELDDLPAAAVYYAGWDRSPADPKSVAALHHPNTDAQRIAIDGEKALTTSHLSDRPRVDGAHLRIAAWDLGTTEGGSSGAPLFNADKRAVGQLHGGYAACGNRRPDWFGRLSVSWEGGRTQGSRLRDWLDPLATGTVVLDGLDSFSVQIQK